jgi:Xylose isomerase-like TIM barrel
MGPIGFSTGALCFSDFRGALQLLSGTHAAAVELSALRQKELEPLVRAIPAIVLSQFAHVSAHLPSAIEKNFESQLLDSVAHFPASWLLVTHPDIISQWERWRALGARLCIENMDKRKAIGQTAKDLREIFRQLPEAKFCFDIGHAHQVDPTMGEAVLILEEFRGRLGQLHVSEVNSESKHDPISRESASAFSMLAQYLPENVPIILESRLRPLSEQAIQAEIDYARDVLNPARRFALAGD